MKCQQKNQRKGINHFNSIYGKALVCVMINCSDVEHKEGGCLMFGTN